MVGWAMPTVGALVLVCVEQLYQVIVMFYFGKSDACFDASLATGYPRSRSFVGRSETRCSETRCRVTGVFC